MQANSCDRSIESTSVGFHAELNRLSSASAKGVGLLISKDGEHINLDWCLVDRPYEHDCKIENVLLGGDLFRPVSERMVDNFYFRGDLI